MASFVIEGGHRLSGEIHPQGAKTVSYTHLTLPTNSLV